MTVSVAVSHSIRLNEDPYCILCRAIWVYVYDRRKVKMSWCITQSFGFVCLFVFKQGTVNVLSVSNDETVSSPFGVTVPELET